MKTKKSRTLIRCRGGISYKNLRNTILDHDLTDDHTIVLNSRDIDKIVLEYSEFYRSGITFPHYLLDVEIREAYSIEIVPRGSLLVIST